MPSHGAPGETDRDEGAIIGGDTDAEDVPLGWRIVAVPARAPIAGGPL
jgi:hypothetical protein